MSKPHSTPPSPSGKAIKPSRPTDQSIQPITTGKPAKPAKPYPEFPLTAHPAGYWCKKIRGKLHYFGPRFNPTDPDSVTKAADAALTEYNQKAEALHTGRAARESSDGLTVKQLCNKFVNAKAASRDTGEITPRSWQDYKDACELIIKHFGAGRLVADLGPDDFAELRKKLAKRWGPGTLGNVINRMRVAFKYASDNGLIDRPVCYGSAFKRPSRKTLRIDKARKGRKLLTAEEICRLINAATPQVKAMILLGINCGFGNADCGTLPLSAVDFDNGVIDYPRPKTGIPRRCPLWPETAAAIQEALAVRPEPKKPAHKGLVFMTKYGQPWAKLSTDNTLAKELGKLLRELHINGRKGLGFYTLRHTFRTIADEAKDQPAADYIMGHEVAHMSSVYRETISDARLKAVADHVRAWLFPPAAEVDSASPATAE
jgi:integrase